MVAAVSPPLAVLQSLAASPLLLASAAPTLPPGSSGGAGAWLLELPGRILVGAWETLFLAAPFVLLGLAVAGLLHLLVSRRTVERWMGGRGMGSVARAAAFGVPLPVCSCGVVPIAMELERKGASRPASLSFLITTPESSADAVFLTWAMLGPVMAIVRPVASFLTAVLAGGLALLGFGGPRPSGGSASGDGIGDKVGGGAGIDPAASAAAAAACGCDDGCEPAALEPAADEAVGVRGLARSFVHWLRSGGGASVEASTPEGPHQDGTPPDGALPDDGRRNDAPAPFPRLVRRMGRYAFVELLDDIAFWLVVGCLLTGVVVALVPGGLEGTPLGSGLLPMLVLLVAGVPLYMCASSSTPVGAALVAKGVSPGAVLVFLLSGPATNAATVVLLTQTFGAAFVRVYVASIALGALAAGIALDLALAALGLDVVARLSVETEGVVGVLHWLTAGVFVALLIWRLTRGALARGWRELTGNLASLGASLRGATGRSDRRAA